MTNDFVLLKHNGLIFISDDQGMIIHSKNQRHGIFYNDTRLLSEFSFNIRGIPLMLLNRNYNTIGCEYIYTNKKFILDNGKEIPEYAFQFILRQNVKEKVFYNIEIENYLQESITLPLKVTLDSDFADIFEVRGDRFIDKREKTKFTNKNSVLYQYQGKDGVFRSCKVNFSENCQWNLEEKDIAYIDLNIASREKYNINIEVILETDGQRTITLDNWEHTQIYVDNEKYQKVIEQSLVDLNILRTKWDGREFFAAGIPNFSTLFGRDSMITAFQTLLLDFKIMRSTLELLATEQAKEENIDRASEPGKILHEFRKSELSNTGKVPFGRYYGSIDSTLFFIIFLHEYYDWTGDKDFLIKMKPYLQRALDWVNSYGDIDGDGYIEYLNKGNRGLNHQGWKDSENPLVNKKGEFPGGAIALSEIQGYVYLAKKKAAEIFELLNCSNKAVQLRKEAEKLKNNFTNDFYMGNDGYFAVALDGNKEKVDSITSNIGQCLFTGIINEEKLDNVISILMSEKMFNGWGIRTLSCDNPAYNPISYHLGSVWPHDTSLIAWGMKKAGRSKEAVKVAKALFETAQHFQFYRLPELLCGFSKQEKQWPIEYPVSCKPQAWAAAAPILMIQLFLGIKSNAKRNEFYVNPMFPEDINYIKICSLKVGENFIDFEVYREGIEIKHNILKNEGKVKLIFEVGD